MTPPPLELPTARLPFGDDDFSWERFEQFCLGLVRRLPNVREAYRYGKAGENQRGIDIVAELDDGTKSTYQCRRRKTFGPRSAEKTVADTNYEAEHHFIVVTCTVSRDTRDYVDGLADWTLWDIDEISDEVRKLPREEGRRLVEDTFGTAVRRVFLGPEGSLVFEAPGDHFAPLVGQGGLFRHDWTLVGRQELVEELVDFARSPERRFALLVGRGGVGKSRILRAVGEQLADSGERVLFASESVAELNQEMLDELPLGPALVVVDDAHRRRGLEMLAQIAARPNRALKVIFATRPQRVEELLAALAQTGHDPERLLRPAELGELDRQHREALAAQALGSTQQHLAETLAEVTADCPLVTVVGGQLIAREQIAPALLERSGAFREAVLGRFEAETLARTSDLVPHEAGRELLSLVAALAPLDVDAPGTAGALGAFLGVADVEVRTWLGELEAVGVLIRRGRLVRIAPDVLADHILHRSCFTPQGQPTGFAEQIYERFRGVGRRVLLLNLAELDWRVRATEADRGVFESVWAETASSLLAAPLFECAAMLDELAPVAFYQPKRVLELLERLRASLPPPVDFLDWHFGPEIVLEKFPRLLRSIAYSLDHLPGCVQLLWDLGCDEPREVNRHPAMQTLGELVGYEADKPLAYNRAALAALEPILADPEAGRAEHVPHELLGGLLAREGTQTRFLEAGNVSFRPYLVSYEATKDIRDRARELLATGVRSPDLAIAHAAARTLTEGLHLPRGTMGAQIGEEDRARWLPEQLVLLEDIGGLLSPSRDPLVRKTLREALERERDRSPFEAVVRAAADRLVSESSDFFDNLTAALVEPWSLRDLDDDRARVHWVAEELARRYTDSTQLRRLLENRLEELTLARATTEPGLLLGLLAETAPDAGAGLAGLVIEERGLLTTHLSVLLSGLRRVNDPRIGALLDELSRRRRPDLVRALAGFYAGGAWLPAFGDADKRALGRLLRSRDASVRRSGVIALSRLPPERSDAAIRLVREALARGSDELAAALLPVFGPQEGGIPYDLLNHQDIQTLLRRLARVAELDWHSAGGLLAHVGQGDAEAVVGFLLRRVEAGNGELDFRALPLDGFPVDVLDGADETTRENLLRRVRDRYDPSLSSEIEISTLFWSLAGGLTDSALLVVHEWIASEDPERVVLAGELLVALNLEESLMLSRPAFVVDALERARTLNGEVLKRLEAVFLGGATVTSWQRAPGRPSNEHVRVREGARQVARMLPEGSRGRWIYNELVRRTEKDISDGLREDEERVWAHS